MTVELRDVFYDMTLVDENGKATPEFLEVMKRLLEAVEELQTP